MSTRRRLRKFLHDYHGAVSREWLQTIARRAAAGVRWPDPYQIALSLGIVVKLRDLGGERFAICNDLIIVGDHLDHHVRCHRLATALAQYLLFLSNAKWAEHDSYVLAFELLMPRESVLSTPPTALASCPAHVHPGLLETWHEYVHKSA